MYRRSLGGFHGRVYSLQILMCLHHKVLSDNGVCPEMADEQE